MKKIIAVILIVSLSGCQAIQIRTMKKEMVECVKDTQQAPEFQRIISTHYMPFINENSKTILPTESQLNDNRYATDDEITDIIKIHNSLSECRKYFIEKIANNEPSSIPSLVDAFRKSDILRASLIEKKITWGEWIKRGLNNFSNMSRQSSADLAAAKALEKRESDANWQKAGEVTGKIVGGTLQIALQTLSIWAASQQTLYRNPQVNYGLVRPLITDCTANNLATLSTTYISCNTH